MTVTDESGGGFIQLTGTSWKLRTRFSGGVWNLFEIMGGLGSMKEWEAAGLAKLDKIHFTEEGYALVGDLLYNALMGKYVEHLRRRMTWD